MSDEELAELPDWPPDELRRRYERMFRGAGVAIWEVDISEPVRLVEQWKPRGDLAALLDREPCLVHQLYHAVRIEAVNDVALRQWGVTSRVALRRARASLPPDRGREALAREMALTIAAGRDTLELETAFRMIDGGVREVYCTATLTIDGPAPSALLSILDLTRLRHVEQELQRTESRYRDILESQEELICRYLPDLTLTFVNGAYCRYFGASREDLIGRRFLDLLPPEDHGPVGEHVRDMLENARTIRYQHRVTRPDGSIRWQQWIDSPILDESGHLVEIQAIGKDITDMKLVEEELGRSRDRYALATSAALVSVFDYDFVAGHLYHDPILPLITGRDIEGFERNDWLRLIHPDDVPAVLAAEREVLAEEIRTGKAAIPEVEFRILSPRREERWVSTRGSILFEDGLPIRALGTIIDVTTRKRAQQEIERGSREIQRLARHLIKAQEEERRRISRELHDELNQDIAALGIGISAVRRRIGTEVRGAAEELAELQRQTAELAARVRGLSHRLHPTALEHVGLVGALRSLADEVQRESGIRMTLAFPDAELGISGSISIGLFRIAQEALRNLALHSGSAVASIQVQRSGEALEMTVEDRGKGFDLASARRSGTLGLISMEERVRLLGGTLEVTTRPGGGTRIRVVLPETALGAAPA